MPSENKTPADIAEEERLKKADAESDSLFDNDPLLGDAYDHNHAMDKLELSQYLKQITVITGAKIISLLFQHVEEEAKLAKIGKSKIYLRNHEPFPEKISDFKDFVRRCIASWVKSEDLPIFEGDVDGDFDTCIFPPNCIFYLLGEKDVLKTLTQDNNLVVDKILVTHIKQSPKPEAGTKPQEPTISAKPEPEAPPKTQEPEAQKPSKSQSEGAVAFVKSLQVWNENDVEVIIKQPGKKPAIYTPSNLGFDSPTTDEWKALLGILKNGEFQFNSSEKAKKSMYSRINKKLCSSFEIQFKLNVPDVFKLFKLVSGQQGVRKPIFQTPGNQSEVDVGADIDYSGYDKAQILEEIRKLTVSSDQDDLVKLAKAAEHAKSIGIEDDEIKAETLIQMETSDLDAKSLLNQDPPNIKGKRHNPIYDVEFPNDPKK